MKQLVLKDIRLLKILNSILIVTALAIGFIGTIYSDVYKANLIYITASIIGTYMIVINLLNNEVRFNANPYLLSMPVKRFDIVKARYLTILFYIIFILGSIFLTSNIISKFMGNLSYFRFYPIVFTMSLLLIFFSINIPIQYYDIKKSQFFNAILYALIILFPNLYTKLGLTFLNPELLDRILNSNLKFIALLILVLSLIFYAFSLFVSKLIYDKKEF